VASGILSPSPFAFEDGVGVSHLEDAVLDLPSVAEWAIAGLLLVGDRGTLADPRPDAYEKLGIPALAHGLVWFNRIHVLPRERDLGSVVSGQEIEVEVWNAYLERAQILDDIVITGPAGIEVENPGGLPDHYPASESLIYIVKVSAEGDPQIDNLVTWEFEGLPSEGTAIQLSGFRLIPFPFPPNMAHGVEERFGYLTDVIDSAFDGTEQRVQLRDVPVGSISYGLFLSERREAQMAGAILFGNQARPFGVGRWQFQAELAVAATEDDLNVYCTTESTPFVAGGLVMLWTSAFSWEIQTIASVESDHLVLTSGLGSSWPARTTAVLPAVIARLSATEALSWEDLGKVSQRVRFNVEGFEP